MPPGPLSVNYHDHLKINPDFPYLHPILLGFIYNSPPEHFPAVVPSHQNGSLIMLEREQLSTLANTVYSDELFNLLLRLNGSGAIRDTEIVFSPEGEPRVFFKGNDLSDPVQRMEFAEEVVKAFEELWREFPFMMQGELERLRQPWSESNLNGMNDPNGLNSLSENTPQIGTPPQPEVAPETEDVEEDCCDCKSVRTAINRDQLTKISQLSRATFPWVTYHRKPIWDALAALVPLSGAADFYKHYSDGYSKRVLNNLQLHEDMALYVLKDYPSPDKGFALWTVDGQRADGLFSVLGLVHQASPIVVGAPFVFEQHHDSGRLAFSQALVYNANPQQPHDHRIDLTCKRITPNDQPRVGLDTLNWTDEVTELVAVTDAGGAPSDAFPEIKLNWQAKLVPATSARLQDLKNDVSTLPGMFQPVVGKLIDNVPQALIGH